MKILIRSSIVLISLLLLRSTSLGETDFRIETDLFYAGTDNPRQALDMVLPKVPASEKLPVVVFIHGGGWRNGNKSGALHQRLAKYAASGKYVAVSVGYRLSGEAKWPAQIHDCKAAIRWIRANADKYGIDPDRIGVWGTSAGGHLVAMLGTSAGVKSMDGNLGPYPDVSSKVTCVADFFGPTDFLTMDQFSTADARFKHDSADSPESLLIGAPIQEVPELVKTANPITYVDGDEPPFLIVHGTDDPLVPFNQSEILKAALDREKVPNTLITVKGGGHGKGFGPDVTDVLDRFFNHHLLHKETVWKDITIKAQPRN